MRRVAVVGAGAAGVCAAFAAAKAGAQVTLYEVGDRIGGTTALSGGNGWFPGNRHVPDDSPELGLAYLRALSLGDADDAVLEVFAREAGPSVDRIEHETPVAWQSIAYADYHAEFEGGREQGGRTLEPVPIDPPPHVAALVRDAPNVTAPVTYVELATGEIDREELALRKERGTFTLGRALLAGLLEACLDAGVEVPDGGEGAGAPGRRRSRAHDGRVRARPATRTRLPPRPHARPGRRPVLARRRTPARDRGRRPAGHDERGVVVPGGPDPG